MSFICKACGRQRAGASFSIVVETARAYNDALTRATET